MAKFDRVVCPFCIFTSKYIDLILTQDGDYICPGCNATFLYEELMQILSFSQLMNAKRREDYLINQ